MENGINYERKRDFPIRPEQITKWSCEGVCTNKDNECSFCGVSKKEFVIGSLIEVFLNNTNYPVALIEKIKCDKIENEIPENIKRTAEKDPSIFVKWDYINSENPDKLKDPEKEISFLYVNYDGDKHSVYHSYVLSKFYSGWDPEKPCYQQRAKDPAFLDGCMQSDLKGAKKVFQTRTQYEYECNNNYNKSDCPLVEIAYPILTEDGICVAVMIIGQIPMTEFSKNKEQINKDLFDNVQSFIDVVEEQIELKNSEILTRLLETIITTLTTITKSLIKEQLKDELKMCCSEDKEKNELEYSEKTSLSIDRHIVSPDLTMLAVIKQMRSICDEVVFYYTPESDATLFHILETNNKENLFNFNITKAPNIKEKKDAVQELHINSDQRDGVHLFISSPLDDGPNYYLGIEILWDDYQSFSGGLKDSISRFANALGKVLHDALMTHISEDKQRMLSDLVQNLSHDLNQKIEIVENHAIVTEKRIQTNSMEQITDAVFNFAKDVRNMTKQLRFFVDETRARATNEPVPYNLSSFQPYGAFLFNLNEHYFRMIEKSRRRYISPTVYEVRSSHPDRYPEMYADRVAMERCINNLLSNALKYSFKYTNIYLDCFFDRNIDRKNYILKVTNFGKIIPEDFAEHIYERGIRWEDSQGRGKGRGIGLAVVKEICEEHKGSVELEKNMVISKYNIPVLFRIMQEYSDKNRFYSRFPTTRVDYDELQLEYRRLMEEPTDKDNYVARQRQLLNLISEVCTRDSSYETNLTRRYLEASINQPTARITFTVKIPY